MRESKQWSQEKMAEQLNMSPNGYAKIERGETKLYIEKLQQIAKVLGVHIFELMGEEFFEDKERGIANPILAIEIDKLKLIISHQKELLAQKQGELDTLKDVIVVLKASVNRP